ncbi:alanine racemase [Rothia nasimurium]|uniref:alanine racemase n=1 Tax=Rothia nasimurium TaxID=85336 RepID=UPI003BA0C7EC
MENLYRQHGFIPLDAPGEAERLAIIDCDALEHNVRHIKALLGERALIAVVKADAYGHGAIDVARSAIAAGADYLGVVHVSEAEKLRQAGITAPLIAWLHTPRTNFDKALALDLELGFSHADELTRICSAARKAERSQPVRLHLKIDTGLGRNGIPMAELPALAAAARAAEEQGLVKVVGIMTHLAVADEPARPETAEQVAAFERAGQIVQQAGLTPHIRHLANSPATLHLGMQAGADPATEQGIMQDAVRVGLGIYGLSPLAGTTSADLGLKPVMHLQTFINAVKEVPAGQGVSYGLNYVTDKPTTLALVPVGYADGVPRVATGGPVRIYPAGRPAKTYREVGRIAMDQMVIDLGEPGLTDPAAGFLGAPAVLFGSGANPPVEEWADAAGTINYEVVTRISPRITRISVGGSWRTRKAEGEA